MATFLLDLPDGGHIEISSGDISGVEVTYDAQGKINGYKVFLKDGSSVWVAPTEHNRKALAYWLAIGKRKSPPNLEP